MLGFRGAKLEENLFVAVLEAGEHTHILLGVYHHLGLVCEINLDYLIAQPEDDTLIGFGPLFHVTEKLMLQGFFFRSSRSRVQILSEVLH